MEHVRTVLITGASTGIGEACALHMASRGWRVFAGVRRPEDGERLNGESGGCVQPVILDVTSGESVAAAADTVSRLCQEDGLDGLVNNAGIAVAGPMECVPLDRLRLQLEVNVTGQVAVTQAMLPLLRAARGRIVNMGSVAGIMATPFVGCYGASKHAMEALSDVLRFELAPWGIRVVLIEPGVIRTPIWEKSEQAAMEAVAARGGLVNELYGEKLEAFRRGIGRFLALALPVERVADVVERALTVRRPRTRYLLGMDARAQALARRWLPDRLRDAVVAFALGLPR